MIDKLRRFRQYLKQYFELRKSNLFDSEYYVNQYPDIKRAGVNPLWHYVRIGWKEGRNPSASFVTNEYLQLNPDVDEAKVNPLWHYLTCGEIEGRLIHKVEEKPARILNSDICEFHFKKALEYLTESGLTDLEYIFLFPLFSTGGAELVGLNFINYIKQHKPNTGILVIVTDLNKCRIPPDVTENVVYLNLIGDLVIDDWEYRKSLVFDLINATKPKVLHIINSSVGWQILLEKHELIKNEMKVFANIFCNQINEDGSKVGYADVYGEKGFPFLDGLISDNQMFFLETQDKFGSFPDKLHTVYNYHEGLNLRRKENIPSTRTNKLKCLWTGRLDWQKNYPLLFEIAKISEFAEFDLYGNPVIDEMPQFPTLENVGYKGKFSALKEIPNLCDYDCLVFTTRYEGLPNILLEIGDIGIPIIAPAIGGIPELINSETGFLLPSAPSVGDYRDALLDIRDHPDFAKAKAERLRTLIKERHGWESFVKSMDQIPGYIN